MAADLNFCLCFLNHNLTINFGFVGLLLFVIVGFYHFIGKKYFVFGGGFYRVHIS